MKIRVDRIDVPRFLELMKRRMNTVCKHDPNLLITGFKLAEPKHLYDPLCGSIDFLRVPNGKLYAKFGFDCLWEFLDVER